MEVVGTYGWLIVVALLVLVIFLFRNGSFRFGAKAMGAGLELEGKAAAERPVASAEPKPAVHASGQGAVAIGGSAKNAKINTGSGKR